MAGVALGVRVRDVVACRVDQARRSRRPSAWTPRVKKRLLIARNSDPSVCGAGGRGCPAAAVRRVRQCEDPTEPMVEFGKVERQFSRPRGTRCLHFRPPLKFEHQILTRAVAARSPSTSSVRAASSCASATSIDSRRVLARSLFITPRIVAHPPRGRNPRRTQGRPTRGRPSQATRVHRVPLAGRPWSPARTG